MWKQRVKWWMPYNRVGAAYLALTVALRQKANVAQVLRSVITPRDETAKHMSSSSESVTSKQITSFFQVRSSRGA